MDPNKPYSSQQNQQAQKFASPEDLEPIQPKPDQPKKVKEVGPRGKAIQEIIHRTIQQESARIGEKDPSKMHKELQCRLSKDLNNESQRRGAIRSTRALNSAGERLGWQALSSLKKSVNDVATLPPVQLLLKQEVGKQLAPILEKSRYSADNLLPIIQNKIRDVYQRLEDLQKKEIDVNAIIDYLSALENTLEEQRDTFGPKEFKEKLKEIKEKAENNVIYKELYEEMNNLLERIGTYYKKDDILNELRLKLNDPKVEYEPIHGLMKRINNLDESIISKESLSKILNEKDFGLIKNVNQYISSYEVSILALKDDKMAKVVESALKGVKSFFYQAEKYSYKEGPENWRELLAGASARILDLDAVLLPKHRVQLKYHRFRAEQAKACEAVPISSKWIEGEGEIIKERVLQRFRVALKEYQAAKFKGKQEAEELGNRVNELLARFKDDSSSESIQMNILLDLVYCSYDSHESQYKKDENGKVYNIDFSKFLGPGIAIRDQNREVNATLRSCLFDYPQFDLPLSPKLIKIIHEWNLDHIYHAHISQQLVGDLKEFKVATQELEKLYEELDVINRYIKGGDRGAAADPLKPLKDKYGNASPSVLRDEIIKKINAISIKTFPSIHPKAFDLLMSRIKTMKEVISQHGERTTPRMLRDALYPQFKPFFIVLDRIMDRPAEYIAVNHAGARSLESLIIELRASSLASKEELRQMEKAMVELRAQELIMSNAESSLFHF